MTGLPPNVKSRGIAGNCGNDGHAEPIKVDLERLYVLFFISLFTLIFQKYFCWIHDFTSEQIAEEATTVVDFERHTEYGELSWFEVFLVYWGHPAWVASREFGA